MHKLFINLHEKTINYISITQYIKNDVFYVFLRIKIKDLRKKIFRLEFRVIWLNTEQVGVI